MLRYEEFVHLERSLRNSQVLSVYLDSEQRPALGTGWLPDVQHALTAVRGTLGKDGRAALSAFESCVHAAEATLKAGWPPQFPGWCVFASPNGVLHGGPIPTPGSTFVHWGQGLRVAPYLRTLKEDRAATVLLLDSRQALLFRYEHGALAARGRLTRDAGVPVRGVGGRPTAGRQHCARGAVGGSETDCHRRPPFRRFLQDLCDHMASEVERDGWLVVGGADEAVRWLVRSLEPSVAARVTESKALHLGSTEKEIRAEAQDAARELRRAWDARRVDEILELAGGQRMGAIGLHDVRRALRNRQASELLLTSHFIGTSPDHADTVVRAALDQGAHVDHVAGAAAARLDPAGGVAVRLRFAMRRAGRVARWTERARAARDT